MLQFASIFTKYSNSKINQMITTLHEGAFYKSAISRIAALKFQFTFTFA
jgi:hypothetical protein